MLIPTSHTILCSILLSITIGFNSHAAPVNINKANAKLLANSLSGIGLNKARAIINYRKIHGAFKLPIDIVKVKGIGNATFNKNRADILIK